MPLLNKKPLEKLPLPQNVNPSDKVYFLEATDEAFLSYDEFFDRLMELNSTVWTCEFTNRSGLTYFEALESEQDALKTLESFPAYLEVPILWIVQHMTCRGRFEELLSDVYNFMKDRYFVGEEVTISEDNVKKYAHILSVHCHEDWTPSSDGKARDLQMPSAESYSYTLRISADCLSVDDEGERQDVTSHGMSRNKKISSRNNLKLFLKNTCVVKNGERYEVKERYVREHSLDIRRWSDVFGGPDPVFPRTPMLQRGRQSKSMGIVKVHHMNGSSNGDHDGTKENGEDGTTMTVGVTKTPRTPKTPGGEGSPRKKNAEKKRAEILQQQCELFIVFEKARRLGVEGIEHFQQEEKLLTKKEIDRLNDMIKEARKKDREATAKKKEAQLNWSRKRDDVDCDDLKPLPPLPCLPLPEWIDDDLFGECLSILQFFNTFAEILPIKDFRPTSRVTLLDVITGLRCRDPNNSSYASLMQILLKARAEICDEEEGDEADLARNEVTVEQNPDYEHPEHGEAVKEMTRLHEEIRYTQGSSVRNLNTDWMTLTEVLRLHLLTGGYVTRPAVHRHRLFARGSIRFYEDPAYIFRMEHPEILDKLENSTVFAMSSNERLLLLQMVIQQLLTYAKFRNYVTERIEECITQRKELKKLRCWDVSQENESKEARLLREMENEGGDAPARPKTTKETNKLKGMLKAVQEGKRCDMAELERILLENVSWNELELDEILSAREQQKAHVQGGMDKMRATIFELTATFGSCSIGRDRAFRNFIVMDQIPLLLVENPQEKEMVGVCMEETPCMNKGDYGSEAEWRDAVLGCSGCMESCVVHGKRRYERNRWSYVDSPELMETILASLNPRGFREIDLAAEVDYLKPELVDMLERTAKKVSSGQLSQWCLEEVADPSELEDSIDWPHEMIEMILEIEEKVNEGLLGRLPIDIDRLEWRKMLFETGDITPLIKGDVQVEAREWEPMWTNDQLAQLSPYEKLGLAFLQVIQAINTKFIKKPFTRVGPGSVIERTWTLIHWQRSVLRCKNIPSLALHLYSIESAIKWENSKVQAKCKVCRKKGDADNLVLCIDCDRCYHLTCAKPKLSSVVPKWMCHDCESVKRRVQEEKDDEKKMKEAVNHKVKDEVDMDGTMDMTNNENDGVCTPQQQSSSVTRTASGRRVKKAEYNIDRLTSLAPPRKKLRESSAHDLSSLDGEENDESVSGETDEGTMDGEERRGNRERESRKRKSTFATPSRDDDVSNRSFTIGLRDADPTFKDKMKRLEDTIRDAIRQDFCWPFLEPVDVKDVPDYYDIIKHPMDLRTIINKMKNHDYDSADQVRMDADQIVKNCKLYNEDTSEIYECAEQLADFWTDNLYPIFNNSKRRR